MRGISVLCLALIFSIGLCLLPDPISAQQKYGEMSVSIPEPANVIVRSDTHSVILVTSEIPNLSFESTLKIYEQRQKTDNEWELMIQPGRQYLTIRAQNYLYVETKTMLFEVKRAYHLKITQVKPVPGSLQITSNPDGAVVQIRGETKGITPFALDEIDPGAYKVEVKKPGYTPKDTTLFIESNELTTWNIFLPQRPVLVTIVIEGNIEQVNVYIDADSIGVAPQEIPLMPGKYRLTLRKNGYDDIRKSIEIPLGRENMLFSETLFKRRPFYKSLWFLTGSAAAITGGAFFMLSKETPPKDLPLPPDFPGN